MELLEREHFLDALRGCLPGQIALVSGEAGIGKTTLVRAFCDSAGRPVLWGACDALRTPRPLGPLRDIARSAGGELARVLAAERPRHAMFGAFLDQLTAADVVAVVEDAQWADEATLDLLIFTGRRIAATRGLLIVTYRDDEIGPDHPLLGLLGALATDRTVRRIRLPPLSAAAVATLAQPHGLPVTELHARTGGNPFFVTEALADPGRRVPPTVRDAVLARAAGRPEAERDALTAVAIFPDYALLPLIQAPPAAIDACVGAGLLTRDGTRVRFRHELARLAIEEGIPPARRAALHRRALADLTRRGADAARLAYHAEEADDGAAVLVHALAAAEQAAAVCAYRQVADHCAQALRFAAALPARPRAELLERYGEACAVIDQDELAVTASAQALDCWRAAGDQEREAALLARRSHYLWQRGESAAAQEAVRAARALAERLPPGPGLAAAYTWSSMLLMFARDLPAAIETGERAIALAERLGDQALLSRALNAVGSARWFSDPELAERTLLRSLTVARAVDNDAAAAAALVNLGSGAGEIRQYARAERWLHEAVDWCTAHDVEGSRRYATAWLARCLFERGEWAQAAAVLDQSPPSARTPNRIVALTVLGRLRTRRGDPGAAEVLDEAWALAVQTRDLQRLWPVAAGRAELAALAGQPTAPLVRETYDLAVRLDHGWAIGELGQWLGRDPAPAAAAGRGVAGVPAAVAEPAAGVPAAAAAPYRLGPVEAARAWDELGCPYEAAQALAGSPDHLREALRRFQHLGARPAADQVARRMRDLRIRAPRRSTLAHPAGLTAREADVLELLRADLRNAEIAAQLHIAEKTVDHHVSAILAKLGVATRRAAAKYGEAPDGR
jgi:DNA-binding CsgD family transcriptional regulator